MGGVLFVCAWVVAGLVLVGEALTGRRGLVVVAGVEAVFTGELLLLVVAVAYSPNPNSLRNTSAAAWTVGNPTTKLAT